MRRRAAGELRGRVGLQVSALAAAIRELVVTQTHWFVVIAAASLEISRAYTAAMFSSRSLSSANYYPHIPTKTLTRGRLPRAAPTEPLPSAQISLSAFILMSHTQSSAPPSSNFHVIFNNALDTYRKRTKEDLLTHPLAARLQACDTPRAILTILQEEIHDGLDPSYRGVKRWSRWLDPTVNVLFAFSVTIGAGVGLVCLRTGVRLISSDIHLADIFARECDFYWCRRPPFSACTPLNMSAWVVTAYLTQVVKDVQASQSAILEIFERIKMSFRRLEVYTEVEPTPEMMDMMVEITVEVLSILGIVTKEIKQGRISK